ncbi:MAG TPA: hypothetical protein VL527_18125 [Dongiaceae bacterium]|nr:hypothetical protein [Dongiaceae bacterium]
MNKKKPLLLLTLLTASLLAGVAGAQQEINISREVNVIGGVKPLPIALSGFSGEAAAVLKFDLEVQGFKVVDDSSAQYELAGGNNGDVHGQLNDRTARTSLLAKAYSGGTTRTQAHALADDVVSAVFHMPGIGQTKIAFKVDTGANSEVYVSDFDGHNAQAVTHDNTIVAAPTWVPRHLALFYVSYKLGNAHIWFHNLATGARDVFARYGGSNLSPAVSPDGSKVAMILSKSGWVDLWVCNIDGSGLKELTHSPQDESSPCWSPDGKWILFAGKVGERRVLRKISPEGGEAQTISTAGAGSPSEPDWSPDGKWIVFTSQYSRGFNICVIPAAGGPATVVVEGEDPSWSPNSRTVVFARRTGNGRVLSLLDVFTKQVKDVKQISGSDSQPSWAK